MTNPTDDPKLPLIFISHSHEDSAVAATIAQFIEGRLYDRVEVFSSSDYRFGGPKVGANVLSELRAALWRADAVILVYTSEERDWSFCLWECGVTSTPQGTPLSPDATIVVFQCGRAPVPTPFNDDMHVNVRNIDQLRRFTRELLTSPTFLPTLGGAVVSPQKAPVEEAAQELSKRLGEVLPRDPQDDEWSAWPFMRIELPAPQVERLKEAADAEDAVLSHEIVEEHAVVIKSDDQAARLFKLVRIGEGEKFSSILGRWKKAYPAADPTWFDSCCEQITVSASRGIPVIQWTPLREVGGETEYTPVMSHVRLMPFAGSMQFDILFYNLSDARAVPATSKMVPPNKLFHKTLGRAKPEEMRLKELLEELKTGGHNRVVVLEDDMSAEYVVHRIMIEEFITAEVFKDGEPGGGADELTLANMLADPGLKEECENFVVIKKKATLAEARSSMSTKPDCQDVCVTETGDWNEPVLGWLTNFDLARPA